MFHILKETLSFSQKNNTIFVDIVSKIISHFDMHCSSEAISPEKSNSTKGLDSQDSFHSLDMVYIKSEFDSYMIRLSHW